MSRNRVMVEIDEAGNVIRIFRTPKLAWGYPPDKVKEYPRSEAVGLIRSQVFDRAKGHCEYCQCPISEHGWPRGEMHEELPRGQRGEISLENSRAVCHDCHENDPRGHASRKLRFGEQHG